MKTSMNTVNLPDGYNGATVECDTEPIETDGDMLKIRVVNSDYLFRWITKAELETAIAKREPEAYAAQKQ